MSSTTTSQPSSDTSQATSSPSVPTQHVEEKELPPPSDEALKDLKSALETKEDGNTQYQLRQYNDAIVLYSKAIQIIEPHQDYFVHDRAVFYGNRAACHVALEKCACFCIVDHTCSHEEVVADCTKAIKLNPNFVKAYIRRAQAYEQQSKLKDALPDFKKACELDPSLSMARASMIRLEPIVKAQQEAEMQEMLGKLKDIGNTLLGKIGLSLDNFKMEKDPNSGSYSIKFDNAKPDTDTKQ